jgi:aromatic ring-opening dioxygenase catalytic subunit (LigB family)
VKQPTLFMPHGAGPCFFMDWTSGPSDAWDGLATWLRGIPATLSSRPRALLVVSAHWEEAVPTVLEGPSPPLLYDYEGFPAETYRLTWPAPGAPELAREVRMHLSSAGIACAKDTTRGFDHGVFVPLKVAFPKADVPVVQLSLKAGLDAMDHLKIGQALAPLREKGVLIIGSGMSYHHMRGFGNPAATAHSERFDEWLKWAVSLKDLGDRTTQLAGWARAPSAVMCHPRSEHLTPLFVAAGAAGKDPGQQVFSQTIMNVKISGIRFG